MSDRALLLLIASFVVIDAHHSNTVLGTVAALVGLVLGGCLLVPFLREVWRPQGADPAGGRAAPTTTSPPRGQL